MKFYPYGRSFGFLFLAFLGINLNTWASQGGLHQETSLSLHSQAFVPQGQLFREEEQKLEDFFERLDQKGNHQFNSQKDLRKDFLEILKTISGISLEATLEVLKGLSLENMPAGRFEMSSDTRSKFLSDCCLV